MLGEINAVGDIIIATVNSIILILFCIKLSETLSLQLNTNASVGFFADTNGTYNTSPRRTYTNWSWFTWILKGRFLGVRHEERQVQGGDRHLGPMARPIGISGFIR